MYNSERLPPNLCIGQSNHRDLELQILKASPVNCEILQWKHPKFVSILIAETFSPASFFVLKLPTFRKLGPFMTRPFNRKQLSPTPKADQEPPIWDWTTSSQVLFLILKSSPLMINVASLKEPIALSNYPQRLPQSWRYPPQPEVCYCKPQGSFTNLTII